MSEYLCSTTAFFKQARSPKESPITMCTIQPLWDFKRPNCNMRAEEMYYSSLLRPYNNCPNQPPWNLNTLYMYVPLAEQSHNNVYLAVDTRLPER